MASRFGLAFVVAVVTISNGVIDLCDGASSNGILCSLIPPLIYLSAIIFLEKGHLDIYLTPLAFITPHVFTMLFIAAWVRRVRQKPNISSHASNVLPLLSSGKTIDDINLDEAGRDLKRYINSLTRVELARARHYQVAEAEKRSGDVSKGAVRLRAILDDMRIDTNRGYILEIGAGRGGWIQAARERLKWHSYDSYSRGNQPGQEGLRIKPQDYGVKFYPTNLEHLIPRRADLLLSDAGENQPDYDDEINSTLKLMRQITKFIQHKPRDVIIRIPTILCKGAVDIAKGWQKHLGSGYLLRLSTERNTVGVVYFCTGRTECIDSQARELLETITRRVLEGKDNQTVPVYDRSDKVVGIKATWPNINNNLPVESLQPLDLSDEIEAHGYLHKPIGTTYFLKEIGWKKSEFEGTTGTQRNYFVSSIIRDLTRAMHSFGLWKTTSTRAEDTYKTVLKKVDVAPKEEHQHIGVMWECYRAIADHLNATTKGLRRMTDDEMVSSLNPKGAMGWQEKDLGFSNIGEYAKNPDIWKPRIKKFEAKLMSGRPIWASYNSIGKKERKASTSSRLIWFLPATARMFEARIFGHMDSLIKKLPYTVSGIPIYDYGSELAKIFGPGKRAVCDDVAGWDTKISHAILSMECAFLQSLTSNAEHGKQIKAIYRLYSHPMVTITRMMNGVVQDVVYQLRGQVASGRRVTYAMNTVTNIVVTMCRAAYSQGVHPSRMYDWASKRLRQGHSNEYGGKISGDDAAIIMGAKEAEEFATKGADFMDDIGMPRKGIEPGVPSTVLWDMSQIDFCSHSYVEVEGNGYKRWMPIRSVDEILAKATIMIGNIRTIEKEAAWARAQGLNLIVNYHHMHSIKLIAMAILSSTPKNISLDSTRDGWSYRIKPWIQEGDVIDIINGCLFGGSTINPTDYRIKTLDDLGRLKYDDRKKYDINPNGSVYVNWRKSLYETVMRIRLRDQEYENWIPKVWVTNMSKVV